MEKRERERFRMGRTGKMKIKMKIKNICVNLLNLRHQRSIDFLVQAQSVQLNAIVIEIERKYLYSKRSRDI